jgi:hypothetical protein
MQGRTHLGLGLPRAGVLRGPQRAQADVTGGRIRVGVVREDGAAVKGAVVLGVVQPALGAVGVDSAEADADDVAACMGT